MQPALPPLVRAWVPSRIGFATAVYTNGLIIGEIFPAALTIPLVLPMLRQSWQWDFVFWAVPVAIIAAIIFGLAPRAPAAVPTAASRRWMPDFRNPMIWRIGLLLGSVNATYFSMNGFLPDYLTHTGRPDLINAALTALNTGQIPASFLLLASADRMVRTMWSYVLCGVVALASLLAIVFLGGVWVIVGCAVWGCCGAAILVLILALPPLISPPEDVHRVASGMFAISYSCAVIVPIIGGVLWDLTGWHLAPFIPIGICALVVIGLAPTIVLREKSAAAVRWMNVIPSEEAHSMDVFEAVDSRIACRQFFDKPVDPKIVKDLLARAARAASGGNLQSWNIYALTGQAARRVQGDRATAHRQGRPAPRQDRIPSLSRADVRRLQGPPRGARRATLRLARHRPQRSGGPLERSSTRTSSSSTRRSRCSSPSTGASAPANGPISAAISMRWRSLPAATVSTPARRRPGRGSMTPSAIS